MGKINRKLFSILYKLFVIKIRELSIILMAHNKVEIVYMLHGYQLFTYSVLSVMMCERIQEGFHTFFYLHDFQYTCILTHIFYKLFWNGLRGPKDTVHP